MSLSVKGNQLKLNAMEVKFIGTKENEWSGKKGNESDLQTLNKSFCSS